MKNLQCTEDMVLVVGFTGLMSIFVLNVATQSFSIENELHGFNRLVCALKFNLYKGGGLLSTLF